MTHRIKTAMKKAKPSANGKHAKARAGRPAAVAPFSNYAGDVPLEIDQVCDSLMALTGGWPKCISGALCYFVEGEARVLRTPAALFAWIAGHAPVNWRKGTRAVTKEEFFERLHQRERWAWATAHPHFPPVPGVYYLAKPPEAANTGKLDELLSYFRPQTRHDRHLIKALILTLFWGGPPREAPAVRDRGRRVERPRRGARHRQDHAAAVPERAGRRLHRRLPR